MPTVEPSVEGVARLLALAEEAHRARRHHVASRMLRAARDVLRELRRAEVERMPGIDMNPLTVRREVCRAILALEPGPCLAVRYDRVRDRVRAVIGCSEEAITAQVRRLFYRGAILPYAWSGGEGFDWPGVGTVTHLVRVEDDWPNATAGLSLDD